MLNFLESVVAGGQSRFCEHGAVLQVSFSYAFVLLCGT